MAQQGWYPDPGGQPGMFRYWDGQQWSQALSPTPLPGPPAPEGFISLSPASSSGYDPRQPITPGHSHTQVGTPGEFDPVPSITAVKPKKPVAPWVVSLVGALVVAVAAYLIVTVVTGETPIQLPTYSTEDKPKTRVCPEPTFDQHNADHPVGDGWVYGGALAYPMLSAPWSDPYPETMIPFGRDALQQIVVIHEDSNPFGYSYWYAGVFIGELYAGDGFYDPEEGSAIVNKCIFGTFYGGAAVTPETLRSEPYSLDGHDGWITETMLSFNIKNLPTTSELVTVIIIRTSDLTSSIFFSSLPTDAMYLKADIDSTIAHLRVVI
ncbi:MAG: DUF2510 domain-containing protein [Propionibacteriaceae bacterium]|nr:DUF2510 domain-containing protein [Propionibacteriaceae bacterium]